MPIQTTSRSVSSPQVSRVWRVVLAGTLVAALGTLVAPQAMAAPGDTYTNATKLADGSVDFSTADWSSPGSSTAGTTLGTPYSFTDSGKTYEVTVTVPQDPTSPLVSNFIKVNGGAAHNYSYWVGSGTQSDLLIYTPTGSAYFSSSPRTYYSNSNGYGFAWSNELTLSSPGTVLGASEILDLTDDGRLIHHLTLTNKGTSTVSGLSFYVSYDAMMDNDDRGSIYKGSSDSVYIENTDIRFYMDRLAADKLLVGEYSYSVPATYVDVATTTENAGDPLITTAIDAAVAWAYTCGGTNCDIDPNKSITLVWQERYLELTTPDQLVNIVYVDDDSGQPVTPKPGTPGDLTGPANSLIPFDEDDAKDGVPANYTYVGTNPVLPINYDNDASADQTITVHVKQTHQITNMTTTRTIHYVGAGAATPADVVQTITWQIDENLVTGAKTYTPVSTYAAVVSPVVTGFTPDLATVLAANLGPTTTAPTNLTVTVTYLAPLPTTGGDPTSLALWAGGGLMFLLAGALFLSRRSLQVHA